jgi:Xaa-Pro aminopeptidase
VTVTRDSALRLTRWLSVLWLLSSGFWPGAVVAQSDIAFPTEVYVGRRAKLLAELPEAVVVVPGRYMISPGDEPMKQDPDFWYLTGVESPYAVLVMEQAPSSGTALRRWRSLLFLPTEFQFAGGQFPMADSQFRQAPWNRPRRRLLPGPESARLTGVDEALPLDSLVPRLGRLIAERRTLYMPTGSMLYAPAGVNPPLSYEAQFARSIAALVSGTEPRDVHPFIARLRAVKDAHEIAALREAARISGMGLIEAMRATRSGMNDREISGVMEYVWKREGSQRASFTPIVMSGPNLMTLFTLQRERYNAVSNVMKDGDLLFIDYGAAEWNMYGSDLCRTIPVSGRFTPEQRKYYDIVLEAQEAAIAAIKPGVMMVDVIKRAAEVFQRHGLQPNEDIARMGADRVWGLMPSPTHYLTRNAGVTRYSAAGFGVRDIGHMVGLEATDGRDWSRPLEAGMVVTIEPKIYIPERGLAIMIEDEILVTATGHENLSASAPKRAEDIERVMAEGRRARAWEK